jgi:hypothetical protein
VAILITKDVFSATSHTTNSNNADNLGDSAEESWIVTLTLESKTTPSKLLSDLAATGKLPGPVMSVEGRRLICTFSVWGTIESAVRRAVEQMWTALESCSMTARVSAATQISESELIRQETAPREPLVLLCAAECAAVLEVSRQRISQLISAGDFAVPDARVNGKSAWRLSTLQAWARQRGSSRQTHA